MRTAPKPAISPLASIGLIWLTGLLVLAFALSAWPASLIAQRSVTGFEAGVDDPAQARAALARATKAQADAAKRAEQFTAEADKAGEALDKTQREAAALAARIQQAEAEIAATNARLALIGQERRALNARLAVRQRPLVRLTGALQNMARRPLALSALRPGSLKDTVYVRAILDSTLPQVRERTADLRKDIERGQQLERNTNAQLAKLQGGERLLGERRTALAAISRSQQVTSQQASGIAVREKERALALAEEARDLNGLIGKLGEASALREELAALSGPVVRPAQPRIAAVSDAPLTVPDALPSSGTETPDEDEDDKAGGAASATLDMQLHVQGRTITGFGEKSAAGVRSTGVVIAPSSGAQIVAPAGGRVAFSGPYKGFGRIIIIEHATGWTSLITGLERSDVEAGARLARGSPLGVAADDKPLVTWELRRDGKPVNPLEFL